MVLPPDEMPCVSRLVNLQMLTLTSVHAPSDDLLRHWNCFLDLLKTIPSRHLRKATYVTDRPSNAVPAGDADGDWERAEAIVTQRAWAEGEPDDAKLYLHLLPRTNWEIRGADALVQGLRERSCRLFADGSMAVCIM
jgi:hypothetical protein